MANSRQGASNTHLQRRWGQRNKIQNTKKENLRDKSSLNQKKIGVIKYIIFNVGANFCEYISQGYVFFGRLHLPCV